MTTARDINNLFKEMRLTLGSVESFTGGKFAAAITSVPGSSQIYKGGLVTYSNSEKVNLLNIDPAYINTYGACSKEIASMMGDNGKDILDVDVCVSFTGNAGPLPMENRPVGEIFIGFAYLDTVEVYKYSLSGSREEIQEKAIRNAFQILENKILENFKNLENFGKSPY